MRWRYLSITAAILLSSGARGTLFDAAADFSHSQNPNGAWTYGWKSLDGSFHTMDTVQQVVFAGVYFWEAKQGGPIFEPTAAENQSSSLFIINGTTQFAPGVFALHPGSIGQHAVLRWTAPASGTFDIAARFVGLDQSTTTDETVQFNDVSIFTGNVIGKGSPLTFSEAIAVTAGQTLDFEVGRGGDRYEFDTTRVDVFIANSLSEIPSFRDPDTAGLPQNHLDFFRNWQPGVGEISSPNPLPEGGDGTMLIILGCSALLLVNTLFSRIGTAGLSNVAISKFGLGLCQTFPSRKPLTLFATIIDDVPRYGHSRRRNPHLTSSARSVFGGS